MAFKYDKDTKQIKLKTTDLEFIARTIKDNYETFRDQLALQREFYKKLDENIYPSLELLRGEKSEGDITMLTEVYEQYKTYKANIYKSIFANIEDMFDVTGMDSQSLEYAPAQKQMLVNSLEEMKVKNELTKVTDDWLLKGEAILFVGWDVQKRKVRREVPVPDPETGELLTNSETGEPLFTDIKVIDEVVYNGAKVTRIDPFMFVYDTDQKDHFDSCTKIFKKFVPYQKLLKNKIYSIDNVAKNELKEKFGKPVSKRPPTGVDDEDDHNKGVPVLEFWGDFILDNGDVLENYVITVADYKHVIRCESNPFLSHPFVYGEFMEHPKSKRGVSPLYPILVINQISSSILNLQLKALSREVNKTIIATKGAIQDVQDVAGYNVIEVDSDNGMGSIEPFALSYNGAVAGWDFIRFFEGKCESATGIFKNMAGNIDSMSKTATEVSAVVAGQTVRLSEEISMIYNKVVLPMISKISELTVNFKFGDEEIPVPNEDGSTGFQTIGDEVKQGKYRFVYGDASTVIEKKTRVKELYELLKVFMDTGYNLNIDAIFKYVIKTLNMGYADQFVMKDELQMMLNGLPPDIRKVAVAKIMEYAPQIQQEVMMEMQQDGEGVDPTGAGLPA